MIEKSRRGVDSLGLSNHERKKIYTSAYLIFIVPNAKNPFVELEAYCPTVMIIQCSLFLKIRTKLSYVVFIDLCSKDSCLYCDKSRRSVAYELELARTSGWNRSGLANATRFVFCAVQWPHSGRRWQWNTEWTYVLARTGGKTSAWPPVFACRSKQVHTSWI